MKKRILAFILSLTVIFTMNTIAQAAVSNSDLRVNVFLDSLSSDVQSTKTDTQFSNDGGYAIYPEQITSLNYKIIVGAQSGLYEDIIVEEITCYYDANLSFKQMSCYYGNLSNDENYSAEIVQSEQVKIDGVIHNSLKIKNLSLGSVFTSVIFLTFDTPRGYTDIFNNFYCEISKGNKKYNDSDSTAGNALNNGVFDISEDDASAFLNEENLIACPYGLKYEINNKSVKITDYIGKDSVDVLYIPSKIEGLSVTDIGADAFKDCTTSFNTVFVPSSVKNILSGAFSNTSGGDPTITYPNNTSIKNMIISEGVSWISGSAFYNSMDLEKINFPSTTSTIGGVRIGGTNYYGYLLSCGLYLYQELPNPSIKDISVIKDSYADEYLKNITYNDVATFADLISYGKKVYTVHYNTSTNGGDWKNNDTRPASAGDTVNLTLTASKNGNRFVGWNTDPTATKGLNSLKMGSSDIVLYAIFEKTLSSISIESKPTKITYEIGENLNTNGLKLKLIYSDGSTKTITSGFTTTGFSSTKAGTKNISVKYNGLTTTFTVTVIHTHDYASRITKNPTCIENGIKTYTCIECNDVYTKKISALGHNYDSGKVTSKSTCKSRGTKTYTCIDCGSTKASTIAKLTTHTYKTTTTKAKLNKDGKVVKKCTVCNDVASSTAIKYAKTIKLSATSYTYNGGVKTPAVIVKDSAGKTLVKNTDYTVTYPASRKNAGTYKVKVVFKGKYSGTKYLTFKINPIKSSKLTAKLSKTSYTYTGKAISPTVVVKAAGGKTLKKNTDYTVTYQKGRKNVGKYKVVIKFKGNYSGTKTLYFTVNPGKTPVKKLTAGKKSLKVAITKKSTQVTGYEVQYSTSKKFASAKTKIIKSYKTTSVTLKSLKAKKTYYVRVRTYKTVNGKKYYSAWSSAKSEKTK